ncbi:hypothetical protein GOBAR_AA04122 [Gossypium barbadense]|uniref:Arabidopsis retrotransposon Orf1 C-terminal domain-containing protein n=1 Tax=Gossypium barbadense TaxID=3634 RepID=A0A2P5YLM4_GOSBA|nr:hypothetical protein GOBAR_AA04122 [Gossypium barbadense]
MTNTRRKSKVVIPGSKKRKTPRASSSSSASVEARHPYLRFFVGLQEDSFQLLRQCLLGLGRYIDWAALEQVQLADDVQAFITTAPWDKLFSIIESTYMELTLEFCSTFILQQVMTAHDELGTITFQLGGLVHQMSVPEFDAAMGLYTEEFISVENFLRLH